MLYQEKYFYLCKVPLSAEGPGHVEILERADNNEEFPSLFLKYEELRSEAFNEDDIYSIVRADDIYILLRTGTKKEVKEEAFEQAETEIITNLRHRVVQNDDSEAKAILKEVHDVEFEE